MTLQKEEWLERIYSLFQEEIRLYSEILELEIEKTAAVTKADGKSLEKIAKNTYELIVHASELERVRMSAMEEVHQSGCINSVQDIIPMTLTDFLNKLDRESGHKLKHLGTQLKDTVHKLKERIKANDRLIRTRQEFLQVTIEAMRENVKSGEVSTYEDDSPVTLRTPRKRSSVLVNASA
ncbi:FlgN protein [Leptospira inadai serovar Lyme str. 10]|uniref:FlgN protein n=2 Tax=Leptospira inadai serovar Lyme TaxID=293084 RepID=V6H9D3_9LEPT|nr:flagellar protein FlgN [Leptospira inadai]EQA35557.1 FlgN protein [Leptospira inadai serovar Lyme str. 10]PNV75401.1 flagellar protein FlgN [Leptospira inadai serovar Lyme]